MKRLALCALLACARPNEREIERDVKALVTRDDALAGGAVDRVVRHGLAAIPELESALHGASVAGRLNAVTALRRIGRVEAVPILRHVGAHDPEEPVRVEATFTLTEWSRGADARAEEARKALRRIAELRGESAPG